MLHLCIMKRLLLTQACPNCNFNTDFSVKRYEIDENHSVQLIKCHNCNTQWKEIWTVNK